MTNKMTNKKLTIVSAAGFLLNFICIVDLTAAGTSAPPKWPQRYSVGGLLQLPYAEIKEPFTAYWDSSSARSRVDYYNGIQKTYQFAAKGSSYGKTLKIAPMTTETVLNQMSCFEVNGTKDSPVSMQSVLPDLAGFTMLGLEKVRNQTCEIWQNVTVLFSRKNTYTMWVEKDTKIPVRYRMMGYDSLLGSHYDKYYLDYFDYSTKFNDTVFNVSGGMKCHGFPGPGVEDRLLMNPMAEYINGYDHHVEDMYTNFKKTHNRKYHSDHEEVSRKSNFRNNLRFIHSMNRQSLGYSLAINHLADRSSVEIKRLRGRKYTEGYNGGLPFNKEKYNLDSLPDQLDWRLYGAVTQVKDQAVCGSCWSFGTSGAVEGQYFVKTGKLVRLSQQELMDCSWGEGNNGCDGGEDFRAYQWIMKHKGLTSEEQYGPYMAIDGYCHANNVTAVAPIQGYVNVTAYDQQALKLAMAAHGPISVGIDASQRSFSFYSNGVYFDPNCGNKPDQLDHSVLAVGYGAINGKAYWLVKNSWSTYWGNDGYVLIAQEKNNCGVATSPTFVLM